MASRSAWQLLNNLPPPSQDQSDQGKYNYSKISDLDFNLLSECSVHSWRSRAICDSCHDPRSFLVTEATSLPHLKHHYEFFCGVCYYLLCVTFMHFPSSAFLIPQKGCNYKFTKQLNCEFEAAFHPWQPESLIIMHLKSEN